MCALEEPTPLVGRNPDKSRVRRLRDPPRSVPRRHRPSKGARAGLAIGGLADATLDHRPRASPGETVMRHNARQQRTLVLSMFLASVPKLRRLSSQDRAVFQADSETATV
jgi:hypothetical protein